MKRSALGTLLFGGWSLMVPHGDPSAPIETWKQEEAFDTARACEHGRTETMKNLEGLKSAAMKSRTWRHGDFKQADDDLQREIDDLNNARCVPSEAVYPAAKK